MTELEEKVADKLFETMDLNKEDFPGFDENSTIFVNDNKGGVGLDLDSIDSLEMLVMIEKEWGLPEIEGDDIKKLRTVKAIADYIQEKTKL